MKAFLSRFVIHTVLLPKKWKQRDDKPYSTYDLAKGFFQLKWLLKSWLIDIFLIVLGIFSAGFGLKGFLLSNGFIDGGAMGIMVPRVTSAAQVRDGFDEMLEAVRRAEPAARINGFTVQPMARAAARGMPRERRVERNQAGVGSRSTSSRKRRGSPGMRSFQAWLAITPPRVSRVRRAANWRLA